MRVGILGSGLMGGKLGTLFARAGHEVVFSYACRRDSEGYKYEEVHLPNNGQMVKWLNAPSERIEA